VTHYADGPNLEMGIPYSTKADGAEKSTSTIWELYNEKAKIRDKALMKDWESSINGLLLFVRLSTILRNWRLTKGHRLPFSRPFSLLSASKVASFWRPIPSSQLNEPSFISHSNWETRPVHPRPQASLSRYQAGLSSSTGSFSRA
jgi:Family of unknown function (DUF6535)